MGIFKDIMDIAKDTYDDNKGEISDRLERKQYSSLSKQALEGTMQFPVLATRALDIETHQMISKALERNYASFAQIAFSLSPYMHVDKEKSVTSFIKNFHQNSDAKFDVFDVLNAATDIAEAYTLTTSENVIFLGATYEGYNGTIYAENLDQLVDLMESANYDVLNDLYTPKDRTIYSFKNPELSKKYNALKEGVVSKGKDLSVSDRVSIQRLSLDKKKFNLDAEKMTATANDNRAKNDNTMNIEKMKIASKFNETILSKDMLRDNDVKKANELIPTILHVKIKTLNKDSTTLGVVDFLVGIKTIMHPVSSSEMTANLVGACTNNDKVFNFLRWTSGEISFFKDFLFNINELKYDASSRGVGTSQWFVALKRRKALAKMKDTLFLGKRILPNATIVVTSEELEAIRSEYGFDLMEPFFLNKIMQTYFLLGFVVVDTGQQIVHFMFDGQTNFQTVTFSGLERENSKDEKKFKEMLKVMNRM